MKIKLLPDSEKPVERAVSSGIGSLSNAELLALIIRSGTQSRSAIELSYEILSLFGDDLTGLASVTPSELMTVSGIGRTKACGIAAAVEIGKRISKGSRDYSCTVSGADDVAGLFMEDLRFEKKEHFKTVLVDTKGHVIKIDDVSTGDLSAAPVHPREVFSKAVRNSAAAVILVHNHPSGDPEPSRQDIETTNRLCDASRLLGIKVIDHVIIGDGRFESLVSRGLIKT